jgi:hypothetical protein
MQIGKKHERKRQAYLSLCFSAIIYTPVSLAVNVIEAMLLGTRRANGRRARSLWGEAPPSHLWNCRAESGLRPKARHFQKA